ncbi:MAG: GDP-mannose 4,6-dehydratase [Candidatus Dormibacteraeota bacterium]|nr:GDP-mannose 4,6-dehydratase [Candidatus Dormibacteraeota bacterium]
MRVLVTGGAGFIGSHVIDALIERGDEVIVVDDLSGADRKYLNPKAEFLQLDIRSEDLSGLIRQRRPEAISHHAAQMSVSRSVREPLFDADVNVMGSLNVLEAAREVGARFIFASTGGALYGETDNRPTPESHPAWPVSPYGVSKLAFEHYLHCYRVEHQLSYAALRYSNVYGPRQNPHGEAGVVAIFCLKLLGGQEAVINGDGLYYRDYVHVGDVVRANLMALDSEVVGHFNVGTGRETSVNEVFEALVRELKVAAPKKHGPGRPGDLRAASLDSTLLRRAVGWQPQVDLAKGLGDTARWFQEHHQKGR